MSKEERVTPTGEKPDRTDSAESDFRAKCECIRELLSCATRDDASTRYRVGAHVRELKEGVAKYGTCGVARLAALLKRDEATLYRYALVAEQWSSEAFAAQLDRPTPSGEPLSWTHFVELSTVDDAGLRMKFASRAIAEGLSVRALLSLIRASNKPPARERASTLERVAQELAFAKARMTAAVDCLERVEMELEDPSLADLAKVEELQRELQVLARKCAQVVAQVRPKLDRKVSHATVMHEDGARERNMPTLLCGGVLRKKTSAA